MGNEGYGLLCHCSRVERLKLDPKKYILVKLKLKEYFGFLIKWKRPMPSHYLHHPWLEDIPNGENAYNLLNRNSILVIPHDISLCGMFVIVFVRMGLLGSNEESMTGTKYPIANATIPTALGKRCVIPPKPFRTPQASLTLKEKSPLCPSTKKEGMG
ncbi:hypothetical protein PVK06_036495 [Gossypium arboreum]|uniref:Uncharacterized protein n=1 Tax=Gossypium arboreum TaxID=29729 RepID=A0ABR0NJP0_GOSAR|nr:hypothetical protein PVK06_036495 [Gossypium arboreum]